MKGAAAPFSELSKIISKARRMAFTARYVPSSLCYCSAEHWDAVLALQHKLLGQNTTPQKKWLLRGSLALPFTSVKSFGLRLCSRCQRGEEDTAFLQLQLGLQERLESQANLKSRANALVDEPRRPPFTRAKGCQTKLGSPGVV